MTYEKFVVKLKQNYEIFVYRSENMDKYNMAAALKWFLQKQKIPISYLSEKTGIEEKLISKILAKKHVFTAYQMLLICDAIDTEPMFIIREYENRQDFFRLKICQNSMNFDENREGLKLEK